MVRFHLTCDFSNGPCIESFFKFAPTFNIRAPNFKQLISQSYDAVGIVILWFSLAMSRPLQQEQLLRPVPSDIAISDAIAPLPIQTIASSAGIVGNCIYRWKTLSDYRFEAT